MLGHWILLTFVMIRMMSAYPPVTIKLAKPLLQTGILKGILKPGNASPGWYFFVGRYLLFPVVQPQNRGVLQVEEHRNLRLKLEAYVLKEFCSTLLTIGSCCLIVGDPIHQYLYIILGFYPTWAVGHKHLLAWSCHMFTGCQDDLMLSQYKFRSTTRFPVVWGCWHNEWTFVFYRNVWTMASNTWEGDSCVSNDVECSHVCFVFRRCCA